MVTDIERIAQAYRSEYGDAALHHVIRDYLVTVEELQRALAPGLLRLPPSQPVKPAKAPPPPALDVDRTQAV